MNFTRTEDRRLVHDSYTKNDAAHSWSWIMAIGLIVLLAAKVAHH